MGQLMTGRREADGAAGQAAPAMSADDGLQAAVSPLTCGIRLPDANVRQHGLRGLVEDMPNQATPWHGTFPARHR